MSINSKEEVVWSSEQQVNRSKERRSGLERRQYAGRRSITVPDMRSGDERRCDDTPKKIRLTITGRAMDVK